MISALFSKFGKRQLGGPHPAYAKGFGGLGAMSSEAAKQRRKIAGHDSFYF